MHHRGWLRVRRREAGTRVYEAMDHAAQDDSPVSRRHRPDDAVRLLAPFDPVVWDRRRFEMLWGWAYRFEAYLPAPRRTMGHYALLLLWGEQMAGWANLRLERGRLVHALGFVVGRAPRDPAFKRALDEALARFEDFLAGYGRVAPGA